MCHFTNTFSSSFLHCFVWSTFDKTFQYISLARHKRVPKRIEVDHPKYFYHSKNAECVTVSIFNVVWYRQQMFDILKYGVKEGQSDRNEFGGTGLQNRVRSGEERSSMIINMPTDGYREASMWYLLFHALNAMKKKFAPAKTKPNILHDLCFHETQSRTGHAIFKFRYDISIFCEIHKFYLHVKSFFQPDFSSSVVQAKVIRRKIHRVKGKDISNSRWSRTSCL